MVHILEEKASSQVLRMSFETRQADACHTEDKPSSFLNPVGATANEVPPKAIGAKMELIIFVLFVFVRAMHPVVVGASKKENVENGRMELPYEASSPGICVTFCLSIFGLVFCFAMGGVEQVKSIFDREPFIIFTVNGILFTTSDFLEMYSLGGLPPAAYQILQQFRIIIVALLLIPVKGQYQTRLQWTLLFIVMFGVSTYMCISTGAKKDSGSDGSIFIGTMFALAKVLITCLGSVRTDKYSKQFKNDPTHVHLARTVLLRPIFALILSLVPRLLCWLQDRPAEDVWSVGLFHGWDAFTVAVCASSIIKMLSGMYFVALLDSILKGIADSCAVLVVYAYDVLAPWVPKSFDTATFMSVLVVVAACAAYVDSKATVAKASKFDAVEGAYRAAGRTPHAGATLP